MKPYQERVVTEKAELDVKLDKLLTFINADTLAKLDPAEQERMRRQAQHMTAYAQVLGERIAAFV
jgi:hypothetical protein